MPRYLKYLIAVIEYCNNTHAKFIRRKMEN
jgi:hypothetical protein